MEGSGSATIKQRSPSQAPRGRGNLSIRNHIITSKQQQMKTIYIAQISYQSLRLAYALHAARYI